MSARTAASLASGLFRVRGARTGQPVRRGSKHAGAIERDRWRQYNTFGKDEHNARMRAAEQFDRDGKLPGKRNGPLGHIALEILRLFLRLRGRNGGRLDPTLAWIARELRRSRSAVAEALARLRRFGFVEWMRRTRLLENPTPDGQYVEQISNAYFLTQPKSAAEAVRRMLRRPSEAIRAVARQLAGQKKLDTATVDELLAEVSDPDLRATLARIRVDVESANPPSGLNPTL